jgi:AbrB family looped-hinge helix DNA binding protein
MYIYTTSKGQIIIPIELRKKYGIDKGTKIKVLDGGDRIVLVPITQEYIHSLRGYLKGGKALKILEDERQKEKD